MSQRRRHIAERLVEAQQHRGAAHDVQRDRHVRRDGAAQASTSRPSRSATASKLGLHVVLRQGRRSTRSRRFPRSTPRSAATTSSTSNYYDIGIAVGGGKGLVVPVLRDAERLSFAEIEAAIADFGQARRGKQAHARRAARAARSRSPTAASTARCSRRRSSTRRRAASSACTPSRTAPSPSNGQVVIRPMMYVALTYDHRIVDGREAVRFLVRIKELVEDPARCCSTEKDLSDTVQKALHRGSPSTVENFLWLCVLGDLCGERLLE